MSRPFQILILSIGSLLGQNILDSLETRRDKVRVTGLNSLADNPRNFRCDKVYLSPKAQEASFEDFLVDIINKEDPDMILPGRDLDIVKLSEFSIHHPEFKHKIPAGSLEAALIMDDKGLSYDFAKKFNLPFAESLLPQEHSSEEILTWINDQGYPILAKPREGFGSGGIRILIDHKHVEAFLEQYPKGYVFQKLMGISEDNMRKIDTFYRETEAGIPFFFHLPDHNQYAAQTMILPDGTIGEIITFLSLMVLGRCEQSQRFEDPEFTHTMLKYAQSMSSIGWRGMFNLQCRKTDSGYIGIEMNGRMSGSTSARSLMGFDDLRMMIKAFYKFDIGPDKRIERPTSGIVYRSFTDMFVSESDKEVLATEKVWTKDSLHEPLKIEKILITGSTGYIGRRLVDKLSEDSSKQLFILSTDKNIAENLFGLKVKAYYDYHDLEEGVIPFEEMDNLFHLGFARPHFGNKEVASSLANTLKLFDEAAEKGIKSIVNISSRSVYGNFAEKPWTEESDIAPTTVYGQAKWASELYLKSILKKHPKLYGTSIRLGTVCGGSEQMADVFVLSKFASQALKGEPINIIGGTQTFDILDIQDAVDALERLINTSPKNWETVYNLSSREAYNIIDLAEKTVEIASLLNGGLRSDILIEKREVYVRYAMDSSRFYSDFDWSPIIEIQETLESILKFTE